MDVIIDGLDGLKKSEKNEIENVFFSVLKAADLKKYSVNICVVDKPTMRDLCARFKQKKKVTDVLSFPLPDTEKQFAHTKYLLGDMVICLDQAKKQAEALGHSLQEELAVLCAHGLLHLLGYDHERSVEEAEIQMQGEMYLLEVAGFCPELSLIGRV